MRVNGMVFLCETLCSFAPSLAPCSLHLPRPASSMCPSCVSACPVVCFFFVVPCFCSLLLPRALRVPSALLRVTLVPLPCAPSLACLPSHSPSRCRPCPHVCPPCPCSAVTRVCHSRALPLPLPLAPTLSPGCSLGPRLSPHPGCPAPCAGGGVYLWSALWPCTPHTPVTLVEFPPLHVHCGARPPRPGVVNPSEHGARKLNALQCSTFLPRRELCRHVPCRRIARTPRLPVHWGATVTWLHCTGFEYTRTAICPSQQSLRSHH